MIVNIEDYVQSTVCKKIEIEVIQYNLNSSAVVNVNFLDIDGKKLNSALVTVDGNEFSTEWVNDEDLVRIVCRKLNLLPI